MSDIRSEIAEVVPLISQDAEYTETIRDLVEALIRKRAAGVWLEAANALQNRADNDNYWAIVNFEEQAYRVENREIEP